MNATGRAQDRAALYVRKETRLLHFAERVFLVWAWIQGLVGAIAFVFLVIGSLGQPECVLLALGSAIGTVVSVFVFLVASTALRLLLQVTDRLDRLVREQRAHADAQPTA